MDNLPFSLVMIALVIAFVLILLGAAMLFGEILFGWFTREPPVRDSIDEVIDEATLFDGDRQRHRSTGSKLL